MSMQKQANGGRGRLGSSKWYRSSHDTFHRQGQRGSRRFSNERARIRPPAVYECGHIAGVSTLHANYNVR